MNTSTSSAADRVRVKRPQRQQIEWRAASLDQLIPHDHRVRLVWAYVDALDLSPLYQTIQAVEGGPGRDAVDPKILMALWMFATIEAVSSARQLERLCQRDLAYMWLTGGVGVNHHLLSDFRTDHAEFLDGLLSDTIATLLHQGLITLECVAQDGMRVRAHAGAGSFRRQKTLEQCQRDAAEQVRILREESESESESESRHDGSRRPGCSQARRQAAQERAARERLERVGRALKELETLGAQKEKRKKGSGQQARCSTTDPEARKMKTADGGYRPAYNVQFASDGDARLIVAVDVTNSGSDRGQMEPMHQAICDRYGQTPQSYLVDGGFATIEDITELERQSTAVYAPIHGEEKMRQAGHDPHARKKGDTDESFRFRQRMATDQAKALYKKRPSIAEFPNAECRNRGLHQFRVRGLAKVKAVSLWYAISFNFLRMLKLGYL